MTPWLLVWMDAPLHVAPDPGSPALVAAADAARDADHVVAARYLAERGGWVQVGLGRPDPGRHCHPQLLAGPLDLKLWVRETDVVPVLAGHVKAGDPEVAAMEAFPGLAALPEGGHHRLAQPGLDGRVRLPDGVVGSRYGAAPVPAARPPVGALMEGVTVAAPGGFRVDIAAGTALVGETVRLALSGCLVARGIVLDGRALDAPPVSRPRPVPRVASVRLEDGAPVTLPDGTELGTAWAQPRLQTGGPPRTLADGRHCAPFALDSRHPLEVCAPAMRGPRDVVPVYGHDDLELLKRVEPKHPRTRSGPKVVTCLIEVELTAEGLPDDVTLFDCPAPYDASTLAVMGEWRWAPPPDGPGVLSISVDYRRR